MRIIIFNNKRMKKEKLPRKIAGNYIIKSFDNKNEIIIEAINSQWYVSSSTDCQVYENENFIGNAVLKDYILYKIKFSNNEELFLLGLPDTDSTYINCMVNDECKFTVGKADSNSLVYKYFALNDVSLSFEYKDGIWNVQSQDKAYYKGNIINDKIIISDSEPVFVFGLSIILVKNMVIFNNPNNLVTYNSTIFKMGNSNVLKEISSAKNDNFFKSPRLKNGIDLEDVKIENPPQVEEQDNNIMMTMMPSMIMGVAYIITGSTTLINIMNNKTSLASALPSLAITFSMLFGMIVWPIVSNKITKGKEKKKLKKVTKKYKEYLLEKEQLILKNINNRKRELLNNYLSLNECIDIISKQRINLWNRDINSDDFLTLRVGLGTDELGFEIKTEQQKFIVDENELYKELDTLKNKYNKIDEIPVLISLFENKSIGIIDEFGNGKDFLDYLILQLMTYYSYDDVKFVTFTNSSNEKLWEYLKILPHSWSNDKEMRYFCSKIDEMKQISNELMDIYKQRSNDKKSLNRPYYVLIIDDLEQTRNLEIVKNILESEENHGFSILFIGKSILELPNKCMEFINVGQKTSGIFGQELVSNKQKQFNNEAKHIDMYKYSKILSNIKFAVQDGKGGNLPKKLSFLEMYGVGRIEQLNSNSRWETNNPIISLQAPIGIDPNGDILNLDLHEKFHGPHGLIAGTTGSGKSEFIITYVLSLAVNYHPHEVSFILIDYKGGGLAGAFENSNTKERIPHLVGTITNLDTASMNRTLVSIESELKRRQRIFNEAKKYSKEGTVDIYKYQRMYREKIVTEPMPSLFIICDEFAELKTQQPEFMEQLISASRIGRSLGIHLILATQKPTGVVNDQIWSNSRFHICLKVQTESDSKEILKKSDAAFIKDTGRFYLQVGNDELYLYGQSAYTGDKYFPIAGKYQKEDSYVSFIDNTGYVYKRMDNNDKKKMTVNSSSELINVVDYLISIGKQENIVSRQLWLDPLPEKIYYNELLKKYNFNKKNFVINCPIGEYDDPVNQLQGLLCLPLSEKGNTILYGMAGSGKEKLISTFLYSAISTYHTNEVNFYILDFGAQVLHVFKKAPQVGDYVTINETEKTVNLFKFLLKELEYRKKEFADYGGSYESYINSGKSMPNIVVILNNYDAFLEVYPNFDDNISKITREGTKYGITFIMVNTSLKSIRFAMRQNFGQFIAMRLNDANDYYDAFGRIQLVPANYKGRGLIELDSVYEFQTASIIDENENDYISQVCLKLQNTMSKAKSIPILPDVVSLKQIETEGKMSVGLSVEDLEPSILNLEKENIINIAVQNIVSNENFINMLIYQAKKLYNNRVVVFDFNECLSENKYNINYINNNFESYINSIKSNDNLVVFVLGYSNVKTILKQNNKLFEDLLAVINKNKTIKLFMVEEISRISGCAYEEWYKKYINRSNGVYIGNGISRQNIFLITKYNRSLDSEIPDDFGYYVVNGNPRLVKIVMTEE